ANAAIEEGDRVRSTFLPQAIPHAPRPARDAAVELLMKFAARKADELAAAEATLEGFASGRRRNVAGKTEDVVNPAPDTVSAIREMEIRSMFRDMSAADVTSAMLAAHRADDVEVIRALESVPKSMSILTGRDLQELRRLRVEDSGYRPMYDRIKE